MEGTTTDCENIISNFSASNNDTNTVMEGTTVDYENISFNISNMDNNTPSKFISINTQEFERILITLITYVSPVLVSMCLLGNSLTKLFLVGKEIV